MKRMIMQMCEGLSSVCVELISNNHCNKKWINRDPLNLYNVKMEKEVE